jgi:hypothetical protein
MRVLLLERSDRVSEIINASNGSSHALQTANFVQNDYDLDNMGSTIADTETVIQPANAETVTDAELEPTDREGLSVLTEALMDLGVDVTSSPFSGDGFTVPHEFNTVNQNFAPEFLVVREQEPFVYAKKTASADEAGQWMLMKNYSGQGSGDDSKLLMWTDVDAYHRTIIVSGVFRVSEAAGEKRLTYSPRYVSSFVSCGFYGEVFRVQLNGEAKPFAVKFFTNRMDWREEIDSVTRIADVLKNKSDEIKTSFGDGFDNAFCALDQDGEDATEITKWLKSIGNRADCIVLKTVAYDKATFCEKVSTDTMHEYVKTLIKCCSYFFRHHPRTIYKDWKPKNMIWNDKEIMLVDLALHGYHSRSYMPHDFMRKYLDSLNSISSSFKTESVQFHEAILNGPDMRSEIKRFLIPPQSIMILHQACTVLTTRYSTTLNLTTDLLQRLKEWVLQSLLIDPFSKEPLESAMISDELLGIIGDSGIETPGSASVGGSLATSQREGRAKFLASLSGLGVLVLASLLPR